MYDAFAPDEEMRVFGRGIRRRIAPMLGGDRQRLELDWSLLFSLPDTPLIVYSDEIGMGEDLSLPERTSVRTPMQWSVETNGGFSTGDRRWLSTPPIEDGPFGYPAVNVVAQRRDCDSLLTWMQRLIFIRRQCPEIGRGEYTLLESGHPAVLAMRFDWEDGTVIAFHNLSAQPVCATVCGGEDLPRPLIEIFGANEHSGGDIVLARVELVGFGYRWLRCGSMRL